MFFEFKECSYSNNAILPLKNRVFSVTLETDKAKFTLQGDPFLLYDIIINIKNSAFVIGNGTMKCLASLTLSTLDSIISEK